jgi:MFS family permease
MIALSFGVIDEVSRYVFRESQLLKESARRLLQGVGGLLLGVGVLLAVYAPGNNSVKWHAGVTVVNRGAAMVQCGLLLSLLLFSRFLGLSWRRPAFGITLGLGILTSIDLAASALRAEFVSDAARVLLNLLTTGTYLVCVSIWMLYLAAPEPEPAPPTVLPDNEVETWNRELQHFLKQ